MAKYPIFLELSGRRAVIVGGGAVATQKAQALLAAGARLVVVSKDIDDALVALCQCANAELVKVATPPTKLLMAKVFAPSLKVTVPPGVPLPGAIALTAAVKVTDCANTDGF